MAGEWIPYDVCLPQKPEVLELVDATGLPVDQVVGRLLMLWGWAALNSSDGSARMSIRLLGKICGGDEAFWREVEKVGWLVIDAEGGTVAIPGWERRFSKSAKNRAMHAIRADESRVGAQKRTGACAKAHGPVRVRAPERRDRGERSSSSSPGDAAQDQEAQTPGWEALRAAWKAGQGRPWALPTPPDKAADRLAEEGWFEKALAAIDRLASCRYFRDPVTLPQFVAAGFVDKILGGQFDNPREQRVARGPDDRPAPVVWSGDDAARFEATKRAMAAKIMEATT